jgi:hypothetical protein
MIVPLDFLVPSFGRSRFLLLAKLEFEVEGSCIDDEELEAEDMSPGL